MGISIGHNWSCSSFDRERIGLDRPAIVEKVIEKYSPNPNPKNHKIVNYLYEGRYLIVLINYPDCTNFEGNKILLFKDTYIEDLQKQKGGIDPHFSNNTDIHAPIARFIPTLEGWEMAIKFVKSLTKK